MSDDAVLTTERLILREFRTDDFEAVHAYGSDIETVEFLPWGPNTEQDTRDFIERTMESAAAEPRNEYTLAVVRRAGDRLIGGIGISANDLNGGVAMLGYCLHKEAWGSGFATEAGRAMIDFGFDVLHLHRIWAGVAPGNVASERVLQKLGMTREGRLREDMQVRGKWLDTLVYAVLEQERGGSTPT